MPKLPEQPEKDNGKKKEKSNRLPAAGENDLFEVVSSSRCKVCQSKWRPNVDMMLIRGFSVRKIAESLQNAGEDISYRSVQRHKESHLNLEKSAYRAIIDKHAEEYEKANAENEIRIISGKAYLDVFIQKGWDQLIYEDLNLDPKDVLKAIELREELMSDGYSVLEEKMMIQVKSMVQAIQEIVPPDLHAAVAARAKEIAQGNILSLEAGVEKATVGDVEVPVDQIIVSEEEVNGQHDQSV